MQSTADQRLPVLFVSQPSQLKAFAHPTRLHVLELLIEEPLTTKKLGDALSMSPARAHYHLKFLERAGLVRQVFRREKAGVIEKYYRAVARKYVVSRTVGTFGDPGGVILETLSAELLRGAVAAGSGAEVGLISGASERVAVPRSKLGGLLHVANLLQAAQDELKSLGEGGAEAADAGSELFELTFALYAASAEAAAGLEDEQDIDADVGAAASAGAGAKLAGPPDETGRGEGEGR